MPVLPRSTRPFTLLLVGALALLGATPAAAEETRSVSIAVDKDGLKWDGPCSASFFRAGETGAEGVVLEHPDTAEPAELAPGRYDVVVSCPSSEGALATTLSVDARRGNVSPRVRLRPAFLLVQVLRDGKEVAAEIVVADKSGHEVQRGRDKVVLPVPAGKLSVLARLDKKVSGRPILGALTVTTREGKKLVEEVDTSDGTLVLALTNNGKPAEGVGALRLPKSGERLVEVQADQDAPVPPGTYDLVTQLSTSHDFSEVVKRNVTIRPGKVVKVRVAHKTGEVTPLVTLEGRPLADDEDVEVELFLGAAPKPFNTLQKGEVATLAPGKYRLKARLLGKKLDDGSAYEGEADARVSARRNAKVQIDLAAAELDVVTKIGGQAKKLEVAVFRPSGEAALSTKSTDDEGQVRFSLAPGRYRVTATLNAPQGLVVTEASVFLKYGRPTRKVLDLDIGSALVQVFERGVAVPAEVLFFQEGASAPLLSVAAGQQAYLPPGSYALAVRRGGATRSFAPIRVAAGRTAERQVELLAKVQADTGEPPPAKASATPPPTTTPPKLPEEMPAGEEP